MLLRADASKTFAKRRLEAANDHFPSMNGAGITPAQWVPTVRISYSADPPRTPAFQLEVEQEGETGLTVCPGV